MRRLTGPVSKFLGFSSKPKIGSGSIPPLPEVEVPKTKQRSVTMDANVGSMGLVTESKRKVKVEAINPVLDEKHLQRMQTIATLAKLELGAPDGGYLSELLNMQKEVLHDALYETGRRDAAKLPKIDAAYVAGSGNSMTQAVDKVQAVGPAPTRRKKTYKIAVQGGTWFENLHQIVGSGVGGTRQQQDAAYLSGVLEGQKTPVVAHSQANLTMESVAQQVQHKHPKVRDLAVTGIGSPLIQAHGPNSQRVTGWWDPIQFVRPFASLMFGEVFPDSQTRVRNGHGSDGYLKQLEQTKRTHDKE